MTPLAKKLEALLFIDSEPQSKNSLGKILGCSPYDLTEAITILKESLTDHGLLVIETEQHISLGTQPELSSFLDDLRKEELNKELTKASLDTLSIILYKDAVTRADIEYIRGVNSSFILRNLMMRGLVDRIVHPTDSRKYIYIPTIELLSFLGVSTRDELPEFQSLKSQLEGKLVEVSAAE
jgi:segregation and condensation protein B